MDDVEDEWGEFDRSPAHQSPAIIDGRTVQQPIIDKAVGLQQGPMLSGEVMTMLARDDRLSSLPSPDIPSESPVPWSMPISNTPAVPSATVGPPALASAEFDHPDDGALEPLHLHSAQHTDTEVHDNPLPDAHQPAMKALNDVFTALNAECELPEGSGGPAEGTCATAYANVNEARPSIGNEVHCPQEEAPPASNGLGVALEEEELYKALPGAASSIAEVEATLGLAPATDAIPADHIPLDGHAHYSIAVITPDGADGASPVPEPELLLLGTSAVTDDENPQLEQPPPEILLAPLASGGDSTVGGVLISNPDGSPFVGFGHGPDVPLKDSSHATEGA